MPKPQPSPHRAAWLPRVTETGFIAVRAGVFHSHDHSDECELHYFTRAQAHFVNGADSLRVRNGSLVFSWPRTVHECRSDSTATDLRFYFVRFVPDTATLALLKENEERLPIRGALPVGLESATQFEQIRRRAQEHSAHADAAASCLLLALLHDIAAAGAPSSQSHPAVDRAIAFMRERVHGTLTLDECADAAGVGKPYLIRLFRERIGTAPMQYYLRLKMDTARYLLRTTVEPVHDIAERLSFWDAFHFSRTFKRIAGVSPREYRRRSGGVGGADSRGGLRALGVAEAGW